MTQTHIATVTLTAAQATLDITGIPQTGFTDLLLVTSLRSTRTNATDDDARIRFNSVTTGYSGRFLRGNGSAASSTTATEIYIGFISTDGATANTFGNSTVYVPNYTSSANKAVGSDGVGEHNGASAWQLLSAGLWSNTAAITSINLSAANGNLAAGSTASLYGISNVNNVAKATGGDITSDGSYIYHTFKANGTFTPTTGMEVEYLVIAGGGGGGGNEGSGGGAGGYRSSVAGESSGGGVVAEPKLAVTSATPYTVTIGAGGAGGGAGAAGLAGANSVFGSITSVGGGRGVYNTSGGNGGSGGGASYSLTPGTGTTGQGFAGGTSIASNYFGGGGGGAGAVGENSGASGGVGGVGVASVISGSSITRAGGGGGGANTGGPSGAGGAGGGGAGGASSAGVAGTANTGGGGGGGFWNGSGYSGGAGGSGIVIIRYPK